MFMNVKYIYCAYFFQQKCCIIKYFFLFLQNIYKNICKNSKNILNNN